MGQANHRAGVHPRKVVSGYLLDTSVALWQADHPEWLSARVRTAIADGVIWLSVINYWEVAIKCANGKLDVGPMEEWWGELVARSGAQVLPLLADHVKVIARLPLLHRDPFDRALIAQAIAGDLVLLSPDRVLGRYAAAGLRVLR